MLNIYALVPQHGTHRFNGHAVGEEHRRGCRVTALVEKDKQREQRKRKESITQFVGN